VTAPPGPVEVVPAGPLTGTVAAPPSKSVTNRVLALAALADGESLLRDPLDSDDARAMRTLVESLGVRVRDEASAWRVAGEGGAFAPVAAEADARLSGTTMRFGVALATLAVAPVTVTGQPPLLRRPTGPLVAALRALGAEVEDDAGFPPVRVAGGGLAGGSVEVDASQSSQFVTAVLLVAPYARSDVRVAARGLGAGAYVGLPVAEMAAWGAVIDETGPNTWEIQAGQRYKAREVTVEYDASAACHLYGLAAATGGTVTVRNAVGGSLQPDARFPAVLAEMGTEVRRSGDALTVTGPARLAPVVADLSGMPDQVTTLAALAALAPGVSTIRGVGVARAHETDRLAALAPELGKLGVAVEQQPTALRIDGGNPRGPARLATYDDHRLAMAFAALAATVPGVVIEEPWCVAKTYPAFWEDAADLGLRWRLAG
jgi:3-phosphoshikimate 1-carboxyvinyltransferase